MGMVGGGARLGVGRVAEGQTSKVSCQEIDLLGFHVLL